MAVRGLRRLTIVGVGLSADPGDWSEGRVLHFLVGVILTALRPRALLVAYRPNEPGTVRSA
jgi:hypothetical protein